MTVHSCRHRIQGAVDVGAWTNLRPLSAAEVDPAVAKVAPGLGLGSAASTHRGSAVGEVCG